MNIQYTLPAAVAWSPQYSNAILCVWMTSGFHIITVPVEHSQTMLYFNEFAR